MKKVIKVPESVTLDEMYIILKGTYRRTLLVKSEDTSPTVEQANDSYQGDWDNVFKLDNDYYLFVKSEPTQGQPI